MTDLSLSGSLSGVLRTRAAEHSAAPRVHVMAAARKLQIHIAQVRREGNLTPAEREAIEELLSALDELLESYPKG